MLSSFLEEYKKKSFAPLLMNVLEEGKTGTGEHGTREIKRKGELWSMVPLLVPLFENVQLKSVFLKYLPYL